MLVPKHLSTTSKPIVRISDIPNHLRDFEHFCQQLPTFLQGRLNRKTAGGDWVRVIIGGDLPGCSKKNL